MTQTMISQPDGILAFRLRADLKRRISQANDAQPSDRDAERSIRAPRPDKLFDLLSSSDPD